jgi:hypothetical protein
MAIENKRARLLFRRGNSDPLVQGASIVMAASNLVSLSGLMDDAKCFAGHLGNVG